MVLLTLSPNLIAAITRYNSLSSTSAGDIIDTDSVMFIDHLVVHKVSQALLQYVTNVADVDDSVAPSSENDKEKYRLNALLKGCSVYIPPKPPKPEPTPEYKALMARLRAEAEAKEYASIVSGPNAEDGVDGDFTLKELKSQLSIIFNILLSTVATSIAVWMVASSWDVPERLALAFTTSLVVCIAEVVIFGGYMRRVEESKVKEKNKKEIKEIIHTWEIGMKGVVEKVD